MNGRDRAQALASALAEQLRQAGMARRRHANALAQAHVRGWCHDGTLCPRCADERAYAAAYVKSTKIGGRQ